jgi:hypothetical protein
MKRGLPMRTAALGWRRRMRQIQALTADVPSDRQYSLKYESLCADPKHELGRLCNFLNISFMDSMLVRSTQNAHHIGGSPSKFDSSRINISLDRSFEDKFSEETLKLMRKLVGDTAAEWGY